MARFQFTAVGVDGVTVDGVENAPSSADLRRVLLARDLQPVHVIEKRSFWQFELTQKKVPRKELMHFSRQMAVFLRAGIPILDALEVISEETGNKLFKTALLDIADSLRAGGTFASSAADHPEAFPRF